MGSAYGLQRNVAMDFGLTDTSKVPPFQATLTLCENAPGRPPTRIKAAETPNQRLGGPPRFLLVLELVKYAQTGGRAYGKAIITLLR